MVWRSNCSALVVDIDDWALGHTWLINGLIHLLACTFDVEILRSITFMGLVVCLVVIGAQLIYNWKSKKYLKNLQKQSQFCVATPNTKLTLITIDKLKAGKASIQSTLLE